MGSLFTKRTQYYFYPTNQQINDFFGSLARYNDNINTLPIIRIIGCTGSGKTTFYNKIHQTLTELNISSNIVDSSITSEDDIVNIINDRNNNGTIFVIDATNKEEVMKFKQSYRILLYQGNFSVKVFFSHMDVATAEQCEEIAKLRDLPGGESIYYGSLTVNNSTHSEYENKVADINIILPLRHIYDLFIHNR